MIHEKKAARENTITMTAKQEKKFELLSSFYFLFFFSDRVRCLISFSSLLLEKAKSSSPYDSPASKAVSLSSSTETVSFAVTF